MIRRAKCLAALLPCVWMLVACGQKGPLYLPDSTGEVVTRPAPAPVPSESTEAPNSPQTIDSPQGGATPAPEVTAPRSSEDKPEEDKTDKGKKDDPGTATPPK